MRSLNGKRSDDTLGRVKSLARALNLLDELARSDGLRLDEVTRLVALPRSTVHRLLTTLEASRYVEYDRDTRVWAIGVQAFAVGAAFLARTPNGPDRAGSTRNNCHAVPGSGSPVRRPSANRR